MDRTNLSDAELRTALAEADRGMRLPYGGIMIGGGIAAFALGVILKYIDWGNTLQVLIVSAAGFLYGQMLAIVSIITARQNAANARMLRALQLLEERFVGR